MRRRRGLDNSEVYWGMCFGARKPTQSRVIVSGCRENWQSTQEDLTTGNVFPRMGHPEMMDRNGAGGAVVVVHASSRKGRYKGHVLFDTARKTSTQYMNAYTAITEEDDGTLFAANDKTMFASSSPTRTKWFQRFMLGATGWG